MGVSNGCAWVVNKFGDEVLIVAKKGNSKVPGSILQFQKDETVVSYSKNSPKYNSTEISHFFWK